MDSSHRIVRKSFDTELWVDGKKLPLNHMMQETLANVLVGFSKTLKGLETPPDTVEVKVKRLQQSMNIDAHTYP